jgi:hypothetical protein
MSRRLCSRYWMRRRGWWFVLCSGVASYPSLEESERMYSGTSSVPKISLGSKSRLKTKRGESWDCNQEQKEGLTENLLSNGALLWWSASLLDGLLSLVRHGFGVFSSRARREDVRWWKCMQVDLQSTKGAILLAEGTHWEWWLVGVHYENTKRPGFFSECEGFSMNSVHGSWIEYFLQIHAKGQQFLRIRLKKTSRIRSKNSKVRMHKRKIIATQMQEIKFHYLLPNFQTSLVQTSQKSCSAQIRDEWSR